MVITAGSFDLLIEVVCEDDDQLLEILGQVRGAAERDDHGDIRVPEAAQADLRLGDQMTTPHDLALQEAAKRNLWLHFTRMSSYADADIPMIVRGSGQYVFDQHGKRYLDGLSGPVRQPDRARPQRGGRGRRAAGQRAGLLPALVLRAPAGHRAGRAAGPSGAGRPEPGVLHHQRLRGGRVGLEAGQAVLQGRSASRAGTRCSAGTSPTTAPRWARWPSPACPPSRCRSSRCRRAASGCRTPTSTAPPASSPTTWPRSAAGRPTRSSGPSCARARSRSPRSSSSRCRTPAAASRRRPATSSGSARSATGTACCSSPTR